MVWCRAAFKCCMLLWALEYRGLQWKKQGKILFKIMHLIASTEAWSCSCWCLAVAFSRGGSGASVLFLFTRKKTVAQGSVGTWMLKMTAAVRLWCRERAVTSVSLVVGWRWRGWQGLKVCLLVTGLYLNLGLTEDTAQMLWASAQHSRAESQWALQALWKVVVCHFGGVGICSLFTAREAEAQMLN